MNSFEATFVHEKATKNCEKYLETPAPGSPAVIGTLYVQRWKLNGDGPIPEKLTVKVSVPG